MRSRLSPEQRERIRELVKTDMTVRTELASVPAGEEPLRSLPSFRVELGPDGRAYAIEPGVTFEPPRPRPPDPPPAAAAKAYRAAAVLPSAPGGVGDPLDESA
jgi:hypothetical protein